MTTNQPLEQARKDLDQSQEELDHLAQKLDKKEKEHERKGPLAAILPGQESTDQGPHRPGLG
jgi:hypothetical protein